MEIDEPDIEAEISKGQASKWMKKAEEKCVIAVRDHLLPELEQAAVNLLGVKETGWFEFLIDPSSHSPVLLFHYPTLHPEGFAYLRRSVKLEFGSLTDQKPVEVYEIQSWIAETFPDAFPDWHCVVVALDAQRSFWEKATILHAEYHRAADKPTPDRYSRHYADTVSLSKHHEVKKAIQEHELRDRVVKWKSLFFASGWARYDLACPPTFKLIPPNERRAALTRDYEIMRDMYIVTPPSFDSVLEDLSELEKAINSAGKL